MNSLTGACSQELPLKTQLFPRSTSCESLQPISSSFASAQLPAGVRPVNRRLWATPCQGRASDSSLPHYLRKKIEDHKESLRTDDFAPSGLDKYVEAHISLMATEFEMPDQIIDQTALIRWKKLLASLRSEYADGQGGTGCGLIYYLTAFSAFLQSSPLPHTITGLDQEQSGVLKAAAERLGAQLPILLRIAALINGLKLVPSSESKDLTSVIFSQVQKKLCDLGGPHKEFVIPLGWMLPTPHGGHLILSRLSPMADGKTHIAIFNPTPVAGVPTGTIPTSFSLTKNSSPETVLKECCSILPLQVPQNLTARLNLDCSTLSARQVEETALKVSTVTYQILGKGAQPCSSHASVFDTMRFTAGKNCVPAAFRMLLYTLVKEEAAQRYVGVSHQEGLKREIETFFQRFYDFVEEKLSPLNSSDD